MITASNQFCPSFPKWVSLSRFGGHGLGSVGTRRKLRFVMEEDFATPDREKLQHSRATRYFRLSHCWQSAASSCLGYFFAMSCQIFRASSFKPLVPKLRAWLRTLPGKLCFRGGAAGAAHPGSRHKAPRFSRSAPSSSPPAAAGARKSGAVGRPSGTNERSRGLQAHGLGRREKPCRVATSEGLSTVATRRAAPARLPWAEAHGYLQASRWDATGNPVACGFYVARECAGPCHHGPGTGLV